MERTTVKEKFAEKVIHFGKHMVLFFKWMLIAAVVGCAVGLISSLFALLLGKVTALRPDNSWLIFCLPLAGLLIVFLYRRILGEDGGTNLVLSTIHGSKGLEYERVILMDAVAWVLPQDIRSATEEGNRQLEEERRLCYVGITRAKKQLWLCSPLAAICHNLGQLLVAAGVMKTWAVLAYLPYLVIAGAGAGLFTGLCTQFLMQRLDRLASGRKEENHGAKGH